MKNIAFIDGQNLHLGTLEANWKIDNRKFRIYLRDKYEVEDDFKKVVLVSGDGDYKKVVDYLIRKKRFEKILFPNVKFASSLYKKLTNQYFAHLGIRGTRNKIEYMQKKRVP